MHFVHCPLCGSKRTAPSLQAIDYITQSQHRLFNCSECGLAYVNPQPRKDDIGIFYPVTYYGGNPFAYEKIDACFRWRKIRALGLKPGKALDCGCGKGLLLGRLKAHGWNVCGTELSEMSANYGREKLGIEICSTSLEECRYSNDEFDLITLFHSLEHFPDPFRALKEIVRILKPDGLLIVEVPRAQGVAWKIFKGYWFHLDIPRHLFHFNDSALEKAITDAGFTVINRKKHDIIYDSFGFMQSLLNVLLKNYNLLNDINTKRLNLKTITVKKDRRLMIEAYFSLLFQAIFYLPALVIACFCALCGHGGTLSFLSRKSSQYMSPSAKPD